MNGNTTAIERLLEVSNQLWDAMYESGEVPTHAERSYYYLALKDAMTENAKLRELVRIAIEYCVNGYCAEEDECPLYESRHSCKLHAKARDLGVEVD